MKTILITGTRGLVGSVVAENISGGRNKLLTPTHKELDITDAFAVSFYLKKFSPDIVVNFAGTIDIDNTEKERGNYNGKIWRLNVAGVEHLIRYLPRNGYLIQISTDAVFPGTEKWPGPYSETDEPDEGADINWYGITKLAAETRVKKIGTKGCVIRISHAFGNPNSPSDLVNKTIADIKAGRELFVDQFFTPTFIPDLAHAINKLMLKPQTGIFHVTTHPLVSRFVFDQYIARILKIKNHLKRGLMEQFILTGKHAPRTKLGGLLTQTTQKKLKLEFTPWKKALNLIKNEYLKT